MQTPLSSGPVGPALSRLLRYAWQGSESILCPTHRADNDIISYSNPIKTYTGPFTQEFSKHFKVDS